MRAAVARFQSRGVAVQRSLGRVCRSPHFKMNLDVTCGVVRRVIASHPLTRLVQCSHNNFVHVIRYCNARDDAWPQFQRRVLNQLRVETDVIQIVVQILARAAVASVTSNADAEPALLPLANAADVVAGRIGEEDIRSGGMALRAPLEFSPSDRKRREVQAVLDGQQQIYVFRFALGGQNRAEQGYTRDAIDFPCGADKPYGIREQALAQ